MAHLFHDDLLLLVFGAQACTTCHPAAAVWHAWEVHVERCWAGCSDSVVRDDKSFWGAVGKFRRGC